MGQYRRKVHTKNTLFKEFLHANESSVLSSKQRLALSSESKNIQDYEFRNVLLLLADPDVFASLKTWEGRLQMRKHPVTKREIDHNERVKMLRELLAAATPPSTSLSSHNVFSDFLSYSWSQEFPFII